MFKFAVHWPVGLILLMDLNAKIPVSIQINVVQNSISATAIRRLWPDASWDLEPRLPCVSRSVRLSVVAEELETTSGKRRHTTVINSPETRLGINWNFSTSSQNPRSDFQPIYSHTSTLRKCTSALHECTEHTCFSISAAVLQYLRPLATSI